MKVTVDRRRPQPQADTVKALLELSVVALAATGCSLPSIVPDSTPSVQACPAALLEGTLARGPDGTAVVSWEFGEHAVQWPDGFVVEHEPELRLLDDRGELVASEGDPIHVGGGFTPGDEVFIACGYVSSEAP